MADDILKFLGIEPDGKEHPADSETLSFLGLKPAKAEHPAYTPPLGMEDPEARRARPSSMPPKSTLQKIHEAIDPSTVIPVVAADVGGNIYDQAAASAQMGVRGGGNILENKGATGVGEAALGTMGVALSPLTGAVKSGENLLSRVTGNPLFAEKSALMFPMNVGRPAVSTALHNVKPSTKAADEVVKMVGGPDEAIAMIKRMSENPRLRAIDVNNNLRVSAQGMIDPAQPNAMSKVVRSAERSTKEAPEAVRAAYDTHLGPAPNPVAEMQTLWKKAQDVGRTKIQPALDAGNPVDVSPVLTHIDKVLNPVAVKMTPGTQITATPLQQRLAEFRRDIAAGDSEVLTDPGRLHSIQSDLRREAQELIDARGSGARLGRQLMDVRNQLVDAIEKSAPGYKKGLEEFRDVKDVTRAFEQGAGILKNEKGVSDKALETHPEALRDWMKTASPEEIAARRLGARYAVAQKMDSFKFAARAGTDVGQVDLNKQKYEILFGKEQTDKMWRVLEDEREIAHSDSRIMGNSKTTETLAAQEHMKPRKIEPPRQGIPGQSLALGLGTAGLTQNPTIGALIGGSLYGAGAARTFGQWMGHQMDKSRNATFADIVTAAGPEKQAAISQLIAAVDRAKRRNKLDNLLAPP